MHAEITSLNNPLVKKLVKLRDAKMRRETGWVRIDGGRELLRALDAGLLPDCLLACDQRLRGADAMSALQRCSASGLLPTTISEAVYEKLRYGDRDEGLCAALSWAPKGLAELPPADEPLYLVLEGLEKPGNLGAILRTADAVGVDAVLLVDAPLETRNPNIVRASMGTLFTVPLFVGSASEAQALLVDRGVAIYAAIVEDSREYTHCSFLGGVALVLGAESSGLERIWYGEQSTAIRIPMHGTADSLNLSVSAAILAYEARRQRDLELT